MTLFLLLAGSGAGTAPGMKVSLGHLRTVVRVASIYKAPTSHLPFSQSLDASFGFRQST